jgi:TRAP-type C4-dicarboxylate transport system substrate-binding protein
MHRSLNGTKQFKEVARMKSKQWLETFVVFVVFVLTITVTATAKPITIKAVSFLPTNLATVANFKDYVDAINKRSKGELVIKWLGGPEIIKGKSQPDAVSTGAIDMVVMPLNFYGDMVPETQSFFLSHYTPSEERQRGYFDYLLKLGMRKMNIRYLGRLCPDRPFYILTKFPVKKPQTDLAGKKLGFDTATWQAMAKDLGMTLVLISVPDWYTSLDRGVVDAQAAPLTFIPDMSLYEVIRYVIDYPLFPANPVAGMVNLKVWDDIPQHLQNLMSNTWAEMEPQFGEFQREQVGKARKFALSKGVDFIKFSTEDEKWYLKTCYESFWRDIKTKVDPPTYTKLRKFLD